MFIEKYQPYTYLQITYNGEEITENNVPPLPTVVNGEYKINLDAIGVDGNDEREDLPFTRNDITWWLYDEVNGVLTKEFNIGDDVGTKFTIDDSGTLSVISPSFSAPQGANIKVLCVLGKPNSLNYEEFDQTIPVGAVMLPFTCSGGGGGGTTFPTFRDNMETGGFTCDLTYAQTYAVMQSDGVGNPYVTIPCIYAGNTWCVAVYQENNEDVGYAFNNVPETVNYGFWVNKGRNPLLFYADNGTIYRSHGSD